MVIRYQVCGEEIVPSRDPKLEKFWRSALRRRERSGMTVAAFCQQEGLKPTTYQFWRREIRRRDEQPHRRREKRRSSSRPVSSTPSSVSLAPVQLIEDHSPVSVEIVGPDGLVVRIPEQASTEHVRRILQLVHEIF